eukprot:CAMPEP_0117776754 /NCGR_PEP_ID=MMETSP0947-20121206/27930_1 /TAXON_ID=44440 /ORGANISM="Chattonella subsalsa, Strain CCMP2191" /LENGTH=282 /DNA_ID=CAMNT_0005603729 /DNA_START=58 /DNA_END=901 /DNA_ORIENTATION=-
MAKTDKTNKSSGKGKGKQKKFTDFLVKSIPSGSKSASTAGSTGVSESKAEENQPAIVDTGASKCDEKASKSENVNASSSSIELASSNYMSKNPNWIANGGVKPKGWRDLSTLCHNHSDLNSLAKSVNMFPTLAKRNGPFVEGYFGQKNEGHKWEVYKNHQNSKEHKVCVQEFKAPTPKIVSFDSFNPEKNNTIDGATTKAQYMRLINIVHSIIQKLDSFGHFEDQFMAQKANGADVGDQYYSSNSFLEFLELMFDYVNKKMKSDDDVDFFTPFDDISFAAAA